jgi:hypothetical protein
MTTELRLRRGTTAQTNAFTGAEGEITINTTTKGIHVHDGTTLGGTPISGAAGLAAHLADLANPHAVTKAQVGLSNVDNVSSATLYNRANHTGTQLVATISDFATGVLNTVLTGLSLATSTAVTAADTLLVALGKLQAQVTLRALLTANTFSGNQTLAGNKLIEANLEKVTEVAAAQTISGGVLNLDLANGLSKVALNANITSITVSNNVASTTKVQAHTVEFTADGTARTITWPAGNGTSTLLFKWPGGTAPTLTSTNTKRDVFMFKSVDTFLWDAFIVGQNL